MQKSEDPTIVATRRKIVTLVLLGLSGLVLYLCYGVLKPFFPVLSWAIALTVISYPLYRRIRSRFKNESVASLITVTVIAILIIVPTGFIVKTLTQEALETLELIRNGIENGKIKEGLNKIPYFSSAFFWVTQNIDLEREAKALREYITHSVPSIFAFSVWSIVQLFLVVFTIFFLFRDRSKMLNEARGLLPLTYRETSELFTQVSDTIYATLYGTLVVAFIQGFLGGCMFWWLGLPGPVLWGTVMGFLALLPYLGAFLIWVPAAIFLAIQGSLVKAAILALWGSVVVGLIDNLLYPFLVGQKLRFHTLAVFFFILGGISFFGASGIVLGPLTLSIADGLLDLWKRRLALHDTDQEIQAQKVAL